MSEALNNKQEPIDPDKIENGIVYTDGSIPPASTWKYFFPITGIDDYQSPPVVHDSEDLGKLVGGFSTEEITDSAIDVKIPEIFLLGHSDINILQKNRNVTPRFPIYNLYDIDREEVKAFYGNSSSSTISFLRTSFQKAGFEEVEFKVQNIDAKRYLLKVDTSGISSTRLASFEDFLFSQVADRSILNFFY